MVQSVQGMIYRVLYFTIQQNLINVSLKMYVRVLKKNNVHEPTYHIRGHIHLYYVNSWCASCLKRRSHNTRFWLRYNG